MDVATVTTSDRSLLQAVCGTLDGADQALLCVAFVEQRGVHLVEKEPRALAARGGQARLVVYQAEAAKRLGVADLPPPFA